MKFWTLYWRSGKQQYVSGETIEEAFTTKGYGAGAINALDFYNEGFNHDYIWLVEERTWKKLPKPGYARQVPLASMEVDGVKIIAINMVPLLEEAAARGHHIRHMVPFRNGSPMDWEEAFHGNNVRIHEDDLQTLWELRLG